MTRQSWCPRLGQRVRLWASAECPHGTRGAAIVDGRTGIVAELNPHQVAAGPGHIYRVWLDHPEVLPAELDPLLGPWCTAGEMEPVA